MSKYEAFTDEQLIGNLRDGEREIMDYIMEKYKNVVRREAKAMYLLGGEKDDLIQEGMIGLFKAVQDYDTGQNTSFNSFAKLCVRRQMYSAIEASKRKKHIPLNSYVSLYEKAEEGKSGRVLDTIEAGEEECLSDLERQVLYLHLLGSDYKNIAGMLSKTPYTIDNALQRIKTKAGKILGIK